MFKYVFHIQVTKYGSGQENQVQAQIGIHGMY